MFHIDENFAYLPIKKIARQKVKNIPVYNFGVDGDESYVAGGVAVHNCTAPTYSTDSLHSAVVEVIVMEGARFRYTTIQNWSSNVYNLVTKRATAYKNSIMEWVDANLGCLTADAQVFLNPAGPVSIAAVKPGDHIYSLDFEEFKPKKFRVNAVRCTGVRKTFRLTTQNFREVKATANHPFLTLQKTPYSAYPKLSWQSLENLQKGSLIAMLTALPDEGKPRIIEYTYPKKDGRGLKTHVSIPKETSEDLLWFLGLYLGDGFIERDPKSRRPRRTYLAIPPKDRARPRLLQTLKKVFEADWKQKGILVTINSAVLADFILHLGFDGTAKTKTIPSWIFSLPLRQKLSFIEGYLDSDGHVRNGSKNASIEKGQITFASANRKLLENIKLLMISCGLNPLKISTYSKKRILYKGKEKQYVTHYLTLNLKENLKRIREKTPSSPCIQFTKVRDIEPLGEEAVYDIEVDGAHNFIANGLIVHNSKLTMKYPSIYLMEPGARGDILSVAFAGKGQHQDAGGKVVHVAPHTSSHILSKSVSQHGGRSSYRGLVKVTKGCSDVKVNVCCDALIMDKESRSDTYPTMEIDEKNVDIGHEASVSKIGDEQLFYLRSRGLSESQASSMIVSGFIEPIVKELPMEYAVEMNRLIQLQMEGSVG
ncbi:MAG: SufD family Fe-S cluster assembly protein [Deltaproteobacteria bacterium]|nr:SufD family Fe-S cluster assembly protein [Deltaproteobacteria bacterium]